MDGQSYVHGVCICGTDLPSLKDDGGWGFIICPDCNEGYDTQKYAQKAGGQFRNNNVCGCEKCNHA